VFLTNAFNQQPLLALRIPSAGKEANKWQVSGFTADSVPNGINRRQKTKTLGISDDRSRINKRGLRKEVDFNASFNKSSQKKRIGSGETPCLF
jgi:hypothetical protein